MNEEYIVFPIVGSKLGDVQIVQAGCFGRIEWVGYEQSWLAYRSGDEWPFATVPGAPALPSLKALDDVFDIYCQIFG